MSRRINELIEFYELLPHPEGGRFREVFRAGSLVRPCDDRGERSAMTAIHFLLTAGEVSRWHRVRSDEVWHYVEGDPLELLTADARFGSIVRQVLGPTSAAARPLLVAPAGSWQAARPLGEYSLASCVVGPGFDFADFELLADQPEHAARLRHQNAELADLI